MARSARRRGKKRGKRSSKSSLSVHMIIAMVVFAISIPIFLALYVISTALLLPAVVAFIIDSEPRKPLARCVAAVNLCGFLPAGIEIIVNSPGGAMENIIYILGDVYYWFYAYGAAAIGWLLFTGVPPLIGRAVAIKAQNRVLELRKKQQKLIEHWGADVVTDTMPSRSNKLESPPSLDSSNANHLGKLGDSDQPNNRNSVKKIRKSDDFPDLEAEIVTSTEDNNTNFG